MSEANIKKILEELYAIDPTLRAHEGVLRKVMGELLASKPDVKLDEAFVARLRGELLGMPQGYPSWFSQFFASRKLQLVLGGVVAALLVAIPTVRYFAGSTVSIRPGEDIAFAPSVRALGDNAFGALQVSQSGKGGGGEAAREADDSMGSAGAPAMPQQMSFGMGGGVDAEMGATRVGSSMIFPDFVSYKFVYRGDSLTLGEEKGSVFRRVKGVESGSQILSLLQKINFKIADISSFSNLKVRSFELAEEKENGYQIPVSLAEGSISINQNWAYWPAAVREFAPLTKNDFPADEVIIGIANNFLRDHEIDTSGYGEPEVFRGYDVRVLAEMSLGIYLPDTVSVRYPLIIDGKKTYDEGGNIFGLDVAVNVRDKRVMSVYNLTSQVYESSQYDLETDAGKVLEIATRGGIYGSPYTEGGKVQEIELGTPEKVIIKYWQYDGKTDSELLVPGLAFPIKNAPEGYFASRIVVPLAKDLIKNIPPSPPIMLKSEPFEGGGSPGRNVDPPLPTEISE